MEHNSNTGGMTTQDAFISRTLHYGNKRWYICIATGLTANGKDDSSDDGPFLSLNTTMVQSVEGWDCADFLVTARTKTN